MSGYAFADILYGRIFIPSWLLPFIHAPEFVRLRGVGLSNVDSYEFKDFGGANRWSHSIAVAWLALRCAKSRGLARTDTVHLVLASLFHDVATPPFAHTLEYVVSGFNHEAESRQLLAGSPTANGTPDGPRYLSEKAQFSSLCAKLSDAEGIDVSPELVADMVTGGGELGFLVSGTIDLDNIDNVVRALLFMGNPVDRGLPLALVDWLSQQNSMPRLGDAIPECVERWLVYRNRLYTQFFESTSQERGRQAFLQYLVRRAGEAGLGSSAMVWTTDEELLNRIAAAEGDDGIDAVRPPLAAFVKRYRMLHAPRLIAEVDIFDQTEYSLIRSPAAVAWIEQWLRDGWEPCVSVFRKRANSRPDQTRLFPDPKGTLTVFSLSGTPHRQSTLAGRIRKAMPDWINNRPWLALDRPRREAISQNLDAVGDWSFTGSRNTSFHPYPSTFVHSIPTALIHALGIAGEPIWDPFCGTGETGVSALKLGSPVVLTDTNRVALLVTKARLGPLGPDERAEIRAVVEQSPHIPRTDRRIPDHEDIFKWHNRDTAMELSTLLELAESASPGARTFLLACLSAVLPKATGRRGMGHGHFADNTPLPRGVEEPPYQNAIEDFATRVGTNLALHEALETVLERQGLGSEELANARVARLDATDDQIEAQIQPAAIVTSPPYLCMSDYSLGQRLTYYWLFPESLDSDFRAELGARRSRFSPRRALAAYLQGMGRFARNAHTCLPSGGLVGMVIGQPVSRAFRDEGIVDKLDHIFIERGFRCLWHHWRRIHWHRNHGVAKIRKERVVVYAKE